LEIKELAELILNGPKGIATVTVEVPITLDGFQAAAAHLKYLYDSLPANHGNVATCLTPRFWKNTKRMRLLCGLTQADLSVATGIALYKVAGAETGRVRLSDLDVSALRNFLLGRWHSIEAYEGREKKKLL
jgi:hypothetical protein